MFFKKPQPKFQLVTGVTASNLDGVYEGFSVHDSGRGFSEITINVSAEKIEATYLGLCRLVRQPAFGLVEIPTNQKAELLLRTSPTDPFHVDVYYYDRMTYENHTGLIKAYSPFFVNDGQITFGYGSHEGYDEVYVGRYKVFSIYTDDPAKYIRFLEWNTYERREPLRTVFDNFSEATPGMTASTTFEGKTIYDLVEVFTRGGFYMAERRAAP